VGNSIQPRDKMAQYRDAALVRRSRAPALHPTRRTRRGRFFKKKIWSKLGS
jgi:hypothetical protein